MILTITTPDNNIIECVLSFDIYGNLYIYTNNKKDSKTYQVNISGKNEIYLESNNYEILNKYDGKLNTFMLLDKNNSLKTKIKNLKIERNSENLDDNLDHDETEYDSEEEYDLEGDKIKQDYYPEDNDHLDNNNDNDNDSDGTEIYDEDNIKMYGQSNLQFSFWTQNIENDIDINERVNGDIMALYDTYIYDNNDNLIFKSSSRDASSIYRIKIYQRGDIFFRPIGYKEMKYKIINENDVLSFVICI